MTRSLCLLSTVLLALAPLSIGQDHGLADLGPRTSGRPIPPGQTCYDVLHYGLTLKVDPETQTIDGSVRMTARWLRPSDHIVLDLDDHLSTKRVALVAANGTEINPGLDLPFKHLGREIRISVDSAFEAAELAPSQEFALIIEYGGSPRVAPRPPWDGGFQWSTTTDGKPWIATSCQMQGPDLWWPCKDQPDDEPESMDIHITVPDGLICASNGQLVNSVAQEGWRTFNWRVNTPINPYGIALNIGPYELLSREVESVAGDRFSIKYWVLPQNLEKGKVLFEDIVRQTRWFEETFGPYPFRGDKYGVVETPHLGMEHQSIIAYGNEYRGNPWGADQGFDFLHHHEMAHEWWANLVTCRNWKDFWIHEGFATYAQSLYTESLKGPIAYRQRMSEIRRGIRNQAPIAPRQPMATADIYFGSAGGDIYNKGAWVMHTLRWLVNNDKDFFHMMRRMAYPDERLEQTTDGSACRFTDTEEIRSIAEKHTGLELAWFFEAYVRTGPLPKLEDKRDGDSLSLRWLNPAGEPFDFPLPVELQLDGKMRRISMLGGKATVDVKGIESIVIDPHSWLLKEETRAKRKPDQNH